MDKKYYCRNCLNRKQIITEVKVYTGVQSGSLFGQCTKCLVPHKNPLDTTTMDKYVKTYLDTATKLVLQWRTEQEEK